MAHTIGRIRVDDFDRFLDTFTTRGKEKRGQLGSRGATVFRGTEDPGEAFVVFDWDKSDVERFLEDDEAREIMREAGLQGPPELTFVERVTETDS